MKRCMSLFAAALLMSYVALAAPPRLGGPLVDGSVIRTRGCGSHFFIAYHDEYALAEWLGGEMVNDGDVLQATDDQMSFDREGRMLLLNLATGRTVDVVIEQALMNRSDYSRIAGKVCR
jgi:hypothetical protein